MPHAAGPDDLAVLPYTSGTTGHPKGTMLTHSNLLSTSTGACAWIQSSSEAVVLGVLPLFHLTGMQANMNVPIQLGGTSVLMSRWDRDAAAELIQRCRVTGVTGITTMIVDFLANPNLGKYDLSSLVRIGGGGASMPEAVAAKLQERIGLPFLEGYGLTETSAPSHANPPQRPKRQCAGIPYFDTDSRVIDPATFKELGPKEVGEIITHGPQVFQGYWKQPKATADAFIEHDGKKFFRTGDLGYYDEEGYFFITDRLKRMINASGFKVWPAEVEAMLYAHPDIQEACVIGTRDAHRGETVKAMVVLKAASRGRVREEDVVAWAKEHMAAFKYPRVVRVRRAAAQDRDREGILEKTAGRGEQAMRYWLIAVAFVALPAWAQVSAETALDACDAAGGQGGRRIHAVAQQRRRRPCRRRVLAGRGTGGNARHRARGRRDEDARGEGLRGAGGRDASN